MAHVNSTEVQTTEGPVTVTKVSTHRDYVAASVMQYADGTLVVLSWLLTGEAGLRFIGSKAARDILAYNSKKAGQEGTLTLLPVVVTLTGKDKAPATHNEAVEAFKAEDAPAIVVLPSATNSTPATRQQRECRCGCGEQVASAKSEYRPGHDARHAGIVARDIASSSVQYFERVTADSDLGSDALREKAHKMAERLILKARKAAK
jgi:hypothetical protein